MRLLFGNNEVDGNFIDWGSQPVRGRRRRRLGGWRDGWATGLGCASTSSPAGHQGEGGAAEEE